jgi:hypothetical protein
MNFRISPRWSAIASAFFLVSATQVSCNRLALGVLAVGFATAFDGLVGGYFAPMGQPQRAPCRGLQRQFLSFPLISTRFAVRANDMSRNRSSVGKFNLPLHALMAHAMLWIDLALKRGLGRDFAFCLLSK